MTVDCQRESRTSYQKSPLPRTLRISRLYLESSGERYRDRVAIVCDRRHFMPGTNRLVPVRIRKAVIRSLWLALFAVTAGDQSFEPLQPSTRHLSLYGTLDADRRGRNLDHLSAGRS